MRYVLDESVAEMAIALARLSLAATSGIAPGSEPGAVVFLRLPGATKLFEADLEAFVSPERREKCSGFATDKLSTTARLAVPSGNAFSRLAPQLCVDDTVYAGSTISPGGVHVAVSGYKGYYDESAAVVVGSIIDMICTLIVQRINSHGDPYIGDWLEIDRSGVLTEIRLKYQTLTS